jgi:hypothetical protein
VLIFELKARACTRANDRVRAPAKPDGIGWARYGGLVILWLGLCGCKHLPYEARSITPGGVVQQGQAVWKPAHSRPELAGELTVVRWPTGEWLVRFEKTPFVILEAKRSPARWSIAFPGSQQHDEGRGQPKTRFAWLYLVPALAGEKLPTPFVISQQATGPWRLENPQTGEVLQGYLQP